MRVDISDPKNPGNFNIFPLVKAASVEGLNGYVVTEIHWDDDNQGAILTLHKSLMAADQLDLADLNNRWTATVQELESLKVTCANLRSDVAAAREAAAQSHANYLAENRASASLNGVIQDLEAQVLKLQAMLADARQEPSGVPEFTDKIQGDRTW